VRNVSLLVAIGVNESGYREILGICEGAKEDKTGWSAFLKHLKERGLCGAPQSRSNQLALGNTPMIDGTGVVSSTSIFTQMRRFCLGDRR
jgi:Transposase, Mutator family